MAETTTRFGTRIVHSSAIRVEIPETGADRRRAPEAWDPGDALVAGIATDVAAGDDRFDLSAGAAPMIRALDEGAVTIDLDVGPDQSAVILTEVDGVFRWVWPETSGAAIASRRRAPVSDGRRVLVFRLEPQAAPRAPGEGQRRGLFGLLPDGIIQRIRVRVLKFAAAGLAGAGVRVLERNVRPGLVPLVGDDPAVWTSDRPVALPEWPTGRPARILLMVHGTFSSTIGSFGALTGFPEGQGLLAACRAHYDLMLGYDHATLGETPEANAKALRAALAGLKIPAGAELDIVAFSRGGLVARVLIERLMTGDAAFLRTRRVVFVGCTNGGTALAAPENWKTLVDLYTNLAVGGGRLLGLVGAQTAGLIMRETVKTLGGLVTALVDTAITGEKVPGLAAMAPDSPLVQALNTAPEDLTAGQWPIYYAFGADFESRFRVGGSPGVSGLPARVLRLIADLGVDQLMKEANDLVVDTEAMTEFGERYVRLAEIDLREDQPKIYHTVYFEQPEVVAAIRTWLEIPGISHYVASPGMGAGPSDGESVPAGRPPSPRRSQPEAAAPGNAQTFFALRGPPRLGEALRETAETVAQEAPEEPVAARKDVPCNIAAEMDRSPPAGKPVPVTVTVSREQIELAAERAGAAMPVLVRPERPITLTIIPRANCVISGDDAVDVDLPEPGKPAVFDFKVIGQAGTAEVWVEAHQGPRRLTRIVLQPVFTVVETLRAEAVLDPQTEDLPLVELRIFDLGADGDKLNLKFVLESRDLDVALSPPPVALGKAREQFVADLYKKLESDWGTTSGRFKNFMLAVQALGAEMFQSLLPESIRRAIWANRSRIGSIEVISQEPFIPWELLYVVDPDGQAEPEEGKFLAEMGLVRWVSDFGWPPARIRVRKDGVRHVVPEYANPAWKLPGADAERDMLVRLFGSTPAPTSSLELCDLLGERDAFDLLHFVCHGQAQQEHIWNAAIELSGSQSGGVFERDPLTAAMVGLTARLKGAKGDRPAIFLNACQAGMSGAGLVGTGGMADSFIKRGAGLFVGAQWSIGDGTALCFAETFYTALLAGQTLTKATQAARAASRQAMEPTWLAYTVYGHPFLQVRKE